MCESDNKCGYWSVTRFGKHESVFCKAMVNIGTQSYDSGSSYVSRLKSSTSCSFITSALQRIIRVTVIIITLRIHLLRYVFPVNVAGVPLAKNYFGLTN